MNALFFRMTTERQMKPVDLAQCWGSPAGASCFLIGSGPSLNEASSELLKRLPIPRFCMNLAGTHLFRPQIWTAYDPTVRFSRSVYLDPGIMKFVHRRRSMDLVPETSFKVCECPNLYFFDGDRHRGYSDFLSEKHEQIVDWNDTFVQAIDIAYRLGFRVIYLLGCEMQVRPSREMYDLAESYGLTTVRDQSLSDFLAVCEKKGIPEQEWDQRLPQVYHFDEQKTIAAARRTDQHYFRICQSLRLSQLSLSLAGLKLISLTPGSRLNEFLEQCSLEAVAETIYQQVGNPELEQTKGRYSSANHRVPSTAGGMRDYPPIHWGDEPVQRATKKIGHTTETPTVDLKKRQTDKQKQTWNNYWQDAARLEVCVPEVG